MIAGPLALAHPLHVVIALKLRNQAQLQALISKPGGYTPLTPAQFAAQFSPTSTQAQQVANFLIDAGFNNVNIAPDRLLVSGDATTATVQTAFNTTMVRVQTHDGRDAFANTSDAIIPAALQDMVQSVLGLQTVNVAHTTNVHPQHGEQPEMQADAISGHDPTEFAAIYSTGTLPTASSISVGIIVEGSMANVLNDLNTFTTNNSLPPVITQVVGNGGSDTSADDEWDLDSQSIIGMSGGVQKLIFYATTSFESSGALIIFHGQTQQFGGISLASPLFVGAWARILAFKAGPIPWAAPLLYGLKARDFHDVTVGNNNGETAAPGWDYTTGFGSLIVNQAAYDLPIQQGPPDSPPVPPG